MKKEQKEKLLDMLQDISYAYEGGDFWKTWSAMQKELSAMPEEPEDERNGKAQTADWPEKVTLSEYIERKYAPSGKEMDLINTMIRFITYSTKEDDIFRTAMAALLAPIRIRWYELDCFKCFRTGPDYTPRVELCFPFTRAMAADGIRRGLVSVKEDPEAGGFTAWIGDRGFFLGKTAPGQDELADAVMTSMEKAFLDGRAEDYAYARAMLTDRGRVYTDDYTRQECWGKSWNHDCDYRSHSWPNDEYRFEVRHVRAEKGVKEHWVLYDRLTKEQKEEKTFKKCRETAQQLSRSISRYRPYAYSPGKEIFYICGSEGRGKGRIEELQMTPDGRCVAKCLCESPVGPEGEISFMETSKLYLREEDALLPGENRKGEKK